MAGFVARLQALGVRIGGLLQESGREPNGRPRMELVDIESHERVLISQNLGPDSKACCVNVQGVASAAMLLRRALAGRPELLVINKFSGLEAKGGGLRAELLEAVAQEIPVLTGLSERHRDAFAEMSGGAGQILRPDPLALEEWWRGITRTSPPPTDRLAG
jgi:nucleoside-triphosphatase THEP1